MLPTWLIFVIALLALVLACLCYCCFCFCRLHVPAKPVKTVDVEKDGCKWVQGPLGVIEYVCVGDPSGQPLLWIGGYGMTAKFIDVDFYRRIAQEYGVRMISVSMPGFGLTDAPTFGERRALKDFFRDYVKPVLDKEAVDKLFLLGQSTGCIHCVAVMLAIPSQVLGVMLCSPAIHVPHKIRGKHATTALFQKTLTYPYVGEYFALKLCQMPGMQKLDIAPDMKRAIQRMQEIGGENKSSMDNFIRDFDRSGKHTYRGWADNMHTITKPTGLPFQDATAITSKGVKIFLVFDNDDTSIPEDEVMYFHSLLPGSEVFKLYTGTGHAVSAVPNAVDAIFALLIRGDYKLKTWTHVNAPSIFTSAAHDGGAPGHNEGVRASLLHQGKDNQ